MALTPIDVQQKTFKIALRGYAEDEVDEFLDEVVISLRENEQRLRDSDERVSILEDQLKANRETEDAMRRTFVAAQRTADAIVNEAREEAERILTEASSRANLLTEEQINERERLVTELVDMREKTARFRASLGELAAGVAPRVEALDAELSATEYEPLEEPPESLSSVDLAEQDAMFEPSDDTAELMAGFEPDNDEHTRAERLDRHLNDEDQEPSPPQEAAHSTWVPVEAAEDEADLTSPDLTSPDASSADAESSGDSEPPADEDESSPRREQFEWSRDRNGTDTARRPWERG